jgi:uncharacterized membrane protein
MVDSKVQSVIAYAAAVRSELADLSAGERDILLEDLEDHLTEVAGEGEGSLEQRLGSPAQYAQELRSAYRLDSPTFPRRPLRHELARRIAELKSTGWYRGIVAFLPELRPAWWVLRGYLAVLILTAALSPGYVLGPLPNPWTKHGLAEIALGAFAIWLSIRIGRRRLGSAGFGRFLRISANGLIAFFAIILLGSMANGSSMDGSSGAAQPVDTGTAFGAGAVTNIYPYSQDGKPLTNVLLFDQDGRPLSLPTSNGDPVTNYPFAPDGKPITNAYPLNQRHVDGSVDVAPRVAIPPWPSPSPSATPSPTPTP